MNEAGFRRLFIGIPLDAACQRQVDDCLQGMKADKDMRWISYRNRHLTLAFLGDTTPAHFHDLQLQFPHAWYGNTVFSFMLNRLARFPDERGHILAAVNEPSEPLLQLHGQALQLVKQCGLAGEGRPFRPYITLGRMRHPGHLSQAFSQPVALQLRVERLCLYESLPTADGRLYKVLSEMVLV